MTVSGHTSESLERREADDCVRSCILQCRGANAGTRRHYHWKRVCLDSLEASVVEMKIWALTCPTPQE